MVVPLISVWIFGCGKKGGRGTTWLFSAEVRFHTHFVLTVFGAASNVTTVLFKR